MVLNNLNIQIYSIFLDKSDIVSDFHSFFHKNFQILIFLWFKLFFIPKYFAIKIWILVW
jgi:hypothetical protein